MKILVATLVVLLLIAGGLIFQMNQRFAASVAENAQLRANIEQLTAQLGEAESQRVNAGELERLKADQREAIRLRGELTHLKQQLTNADANAKAAQQAADRASATAARAAAQAQAQDQAAQAQLVEPRVFSSQVASVMPPGQSLVVGGWPTGTNTITYAFITPTITEQGTNSLTIDAKFVELPTELAGRLGTMNGQGNGQLRLSPEQMNAMLANWKQFPGVNILSSPRLTTLSGMQGTMSIGETRQTPNGPVHFGPEINVLPTMSSDGSQIQINVNAKLTTPAMAGQP